MTGIPRRGGAAQVALLRVVGDAGDADRAARDLSVLAAAGVSAAVLAQSPGLTEALLEVVRSTPVRVLRPSDLVEAAVVLVPGARDELPAPLAHVVVAAAVVARTGLLPAQDARDGDGDLLVALDQRVPGWRGPAPSSAAARLRGTSGERRRVLLVSSNGSGLGHLTRLVAMGRRAQASTDVHVLSMSSAVPLAAEGVLPYEYVPSASDLGISARRWNLLLHRRLGEAVARLRPDVLVFDGTYPYRGVTELHERFPAVRRVWSRRPMWKPGMGANQLRLTSRFDLVVEPGELAGRLDGGLTVGRADALAVRPITLLDGAELLDAGAARDALGMEQGVPTALVTLGAGAWHDVDSQLGAVVAGLRAGSPDAQICLVRPSIAQSETRLGHGVRAVSAYPLSRYLRAFDVVVTAAGYNTFHEAVAFGRASGFVGVTAQLDDQPRRARWAEEEGAGVDLRPSEPASVSRVARLLEDVAARERLERRCLDVWPGNGAGDAMRAVEAVADGADARDLGAVGRRVPGR